jgi:hypothetical protein
VYDSRVYFVSIDEKSNAAISNDRGTKREGGMLDRDQ